MNNNPFSIYDFLGYLFPGLVALMLFAYCYMLGVTAPIEEFFKITSFTKHFSEVIKIDWWEKTSIIIILSYISGHVVAYLSSCMVEYFAYRSFGYPSRFLLHSSNENDSCLIKKYFSNGNVGASIWKVIVLIALLPISLFFFLFGKMLFIVQFITRPLDNCLKNSIKAKFDALKVQLNIVNSSNDEPSDYHRIMMHYVYINMPQCQRKADNYVAIYGFLRAIALIACLFFDFLFYAQIKSVIDYFSGNYEATINWKAIGILIVWMVLCNVLFMGFVKFYRRFAVENYMNLLTGKVDMSS